MSTNIKNPDGSLTKIAGKTLQYPVNTNIGTSEVLQDAPVGHIISYMGTIIPAHYLACDGSLHNIADYPQLANHFLANFGSKNYFGGDGTTTFGVPNLNNGRFLKGSSTPGVNEQAGIPNVSGTATGVFAWTNGSAVKSGAVTVTEKINDAYINQAGTDSSTTSHFRNVGIEINASKSNAVYGKSNTVTPLNTSVLYCIKAEPTYYMEIEDPGYSTDEVFTGKTWIDGKPIYRKVINVTITHDSSKQYKLNVSNLNIDKGIKLYGIDSNGSTIPIILTETLSWCVSIIYDGVTKEIIFSWGASVSRTMSYNIIIEYTKTTD